MQSCRRCSEYMCLHYVMAMCVFVVVVVVVRAAAFANVQNILFFFCFFVCFFFLFCYWNETATAGEKPRPTAEIFRSGSKCLFIDSNSSFSCFCTTARQATGQHWAVSNSCMYYSAQLLLLIIRRSWSELSDLLINIFISLLLGKPI